MFEKQSGSVSRSGVRHFLVLNKVLFFLLIYDTLLYIIPLTSGQTPICQRTKWQSKQDHSCPRSLQEVFTVEGTTQSGRSIYYKLCCHGKDLIEQNNVAAKGCQTSRCVSEPYKAVNYPCSTLHKYIQDGNYIVFEESRREMCVDKTTGKMGVVAVCCPPTNKANLISTEPNEFPHQASLQSGNENCGGTVYNKDYIITAAHCVTNDSGHVYDVNQTFVVLGTNIATLDSKTNTFPIKEIIVHEGYRKKLPVQHKRRFNDIAVLQLARSINFTAQPKIRALPLAQQNFNPWEYADEAVIVGWGTTDDGITTDYLHKANLLIRRDEQCFKPLYGVGLYEKFSNQLLCLGGVVNGQVSPSSDLGDSGGPAICRGADGYAVHCGITSFGQPCSRKRGQSSCPPSVYTDTSFFRDWIINHAGEQEEEDLLKVKLYGDPVPEGEYEHQVHVTTKSGPSCGGTLVSPDTVVTAGHCVFMDDNMIRNGVKVTLSDGSKFRVRRQGGVTGLPSFSRYNLLEKLNHRKSGRMGFLNPPYVDDIAVLKLAKSVPISADKIPKLPKKGEIPHNNVHALELSIPLGNTPVEQLSRRNFQILNANECQGRLDRLLKALRVKGRFNMQNIFCGVEEYSGGAICDRETGGGLICTKMDVDEQVNPEENEKKEKRKRKRECGETREGQLEDEENTQILCGIQSFRMCYMSMPSVFVDVEKYTELIKKVIAE